MKRKLTLILSLIYLASANTFAAEAKYNNLISHKEGGAKNIKITFNELKSNTNIISNFMTNAKASKDSNQVIHAMSKIKNTTVSPVGAVTKINAENYALIYNASDLRQSYIITYTGCIQKLYEDDTIRTEGCSSNADTIEVGSHEFYVKEATAAIEWIPSNPGTYYADLAIAVQNSNELEKFSTSDYTDAMKISGKKS